MTEKLGEKYARSLLGMEHHQIWKMLHRMAKWMEAQGTRDRNTQKAERMLKW
ncbi:hypothetical protein GCM10011391_15240 [Pullulanibacillus camelliae]|uniref:Uncharacterized protein n=1 Tax=Pullulanibacillus camelliae TaxID=1707096 RepID=A0A8J2VSC0_9BACL|nr:hypothetical protein [Pullulanibacillus camelliae]GGE37297.1 hypothetical protein GCM10011391_15240 [Pullulanibacillus camelliae]